MDPEVAEALKQLKRKSAEMEQSGGSNGACSGGASGGMDSAPRPLGPSPQMPLPMLPQNKVPRINQGPPMNPMNPMNAKGFGGKGGSAGGPGGIGAGHGGGCCGGSAGSGCGGTGAAGGGCGGCGGSGCGGGCGAAGPRGPAPGQSAGGGFGSLGGGMAGGIAGMGMAGGLSGGQSGGSCGGIGGGCGGPMGGSGGGPLGSGAGGPLAGAGGGTAAGAAGALAGGGCCGAGPLGACGMGSGGGGLGCGGNNNNPPPRPGQAQVRLEVPQTSIGLLIGKQASTINAIKAYSKAHCFVEQLPTDSDRARVTIMGSASEVDKCRRVVEGLIDGSMSTSVLHQMAQAGSAAAAFAPGIRGGDRGPAAAPPGQQAVAAPAGCSGAGGCAGCGGCGACGGCSGLAGCGGGCGCGACSGCGVANGACGAQVTPPPAGNAAAYAAAAAASLAVNASGISRSGDMPMGDQMSEYYMRWWAQYGNQVSQQSQAGASEASDAIVGGGGAGAGGSAAFDKDALARLAQKAQGKETTPAFDRQALARLAQQAMEPSPPPEPPATPAAPAVPPQPPALAPASEGANGGGNARPAEMLSQLLHACPRPQATPGPQANLSLPLADPDRGTNEVRQLLGVTAPSAGSQPSQQRVPPASSPAPGAASMPFPPLPGQAVGLPSAQATAAPQLPQGMMSEPPKQVARGFTPFLLQTQVQTSVPKDNDAVQKMLQRLQGNAEQTKQTVSVKQSLPPTGMSTAPGFGGYSAAAGGTARPGMSQYESLEHRVSEAESPGEVADVARDILAKLPVLLLEQVAELLQKLDTVMRLCSQEFLNDLSRQLAPRLKSSTSTQFAMLLSSVVVWSDDARDRFAEFAGEFLGVALEEMSSRLMELAPAEVNICVAAFVAAGRADARFFSIVGRAAHARHNSFGPPQLAALLAIFSEMRLVHYELFHAAGLALAARARELRPIDALRALRACSKCGFAHELFCKALGDQVISRVKTKGMKSGFKCEDLCEIAWLFCAVQIYHEEFFVLVFKQLEDARQVATDALCQLYEAHLALDSEYKESYAKYRPGADAVKGLLDIYKSNRRDCRRCCDRQRNDVAVSLKGLVDGTVTVNHRTSTGLLVDVAALKRRNSPDGFVHVELDAPLTTVKPLEQDDTATVVEGAVALRRRILQNHGLRLVVVREAEWRNMDEGKEKRRHLRGLLSSLGAALEDKK